MEPGLHPDIPDAEYRALPYLNQSAIGHVVNGGRSMAHLRAYMDGDRVKADTPALRFGRAFDAYLPDLSGFERQYRVAPEDAADKRLKPWKDFKAECDADGVEPIDHADYTTISEMARAILRHPSASKLVNIKSRHQMTAVWDHEGVMCKARMDRLAISNQFIVDIKTTLSAQADDFAKSIVNYGYHRQAWFYKDAVYRLTGVMPGYGIVAVEKEPPYAVTARSMEDHDEAGRWLAAAESECVRVMNQYRSCMETGLWPGYPEDFSVPPMPVWYARQFEGLMQC